MTDAPTKPEHPLDLLAAVTRLDPSAPMDQVLDARIRIEFFLKQAKDLMRMIDEATIKWIQANGDIEVGDVRYYVGTPSNTKCVDKNAAIEELLTATGGDLDKVIECLASDAIKHGAAKGLMRSEVYERCFFTTNEPEIKEGKPVKKLIRVDQRFLKRKPEGNADGV